MTERTPMIKVDQFMDIHDLKRQGHSIRDIARLSGLSRNTVRKVLRGDHTLRMKATGFEPGADLATALEVLPAV